MLIESQQVIYRGNSFYWPTEIWSVKMQTWQPYNGDVPKEAGWGDFISLEDAKEFMEPF